MNTSDSAHPWDLPPERTVFAVDIKGFSKVPDQRQPALRGALDRALKAAFDESGLAEEWNEPSHHHDRGDGCILVLPPARTWRLVDPLVGLLDEQLHHYARSRHHDEPELQVRVGVHIGPMPASNLSDTINDAARFVDSDAVRAGVAAAAAHGSHTALALSDEMYRRVVAAGRTERLTDRDFLAVSASVAGKDFARPSWIHVPRLSPSVVAHYLPPDASETAPDSEQPAPRDTTGTPAAGLLFSGQVNIGTAANRIETLRTRQFNYGGASPRTLHGEEDDTNRQIDR